MSTVYTSCSGGLWQGRYKASYIQSERYLPACMRYIELNPVRAGMVTQPGEYRWSNYGANALGKEDKVIAPHGEYLALSSTAAGRQKTYRDLFGNEDDDSAWNLIRAATQQGVISGDSRFSEMIEKRLGRKVVARPRGRPLKEKNCKAKP